MTKAFSDSNVSGQPLGAESSSSNKNGTGLRASFEAIRQSARRIRCVVRKEFTHIRRSRQNLSLMLIAPILQLLVFGFASRLDVRDVSTVVADMDRSVLSRQIIEAFSRSGYFTVKKMLGSYDQADRWLETGRAGMAILIPPDLERRIKAMRTAQVGILIDGVDTTTAGTVSGYAQSILKRFSEDIMDERINQMQGQLFETTTPHLIVPSASEASRSWFNPNLNSKDFFVPGVVVIILMAGTTIITSAIIVREKEIGTIEQLMVAPIARFELILGKTIPCFVIEVITMSVIVSLAFLIFDIPFRGSMPFFFATAVLFLVIIAGVGMTISTFCETQQQAILTSFMFLQPATLLSGYAFPIENMPPVVQYLTYLDPLRYFIIIVRGVFLKGIGWDILWPQVIPMLAMAVFYLGLAAFLFKKRAD